MISIVFVSVAIIVAVLLLKVFKKVNIEQGEFEKIEEKKQNEITKAVEKIDSGDIADLVADHNSEVANRDKK